MHFKKTLHRVSRNVALIPSAKKKEFIRAVSSLLLEGLDLAELNAKLESLQTVFPKVNRWVQWFKARAKFIFPAAIHDSAKASNSMMSEHTNAQERVGGDFQQTASKSTVTIGECLDHIYRYTKQIEVDHGLAKEGAPLRYERTAVTQKQSYVNDGRPPDTTGTLLTRHGTSGRPPGARNLQPRKPVVLPSFGIPWSFTYDQFKATNTCALDTVLTSIYLLYELGGFWEAGENDILRGIMRLLKEEQYDEARYKWCIEVLELPPRSSIRKFYTVEDHTSAGCPELFTFQTTDDFSDCDSLFCPNPTNRPNARQKSLRESGNRSFLTMQAPVSCLKFTEEEVDGWLKNDSTERCFEFASTDHMQDKPEHAFRTLHHEAPDSSHDSFDTAHCNGMYHGLPRVIKKQAALLHVNVAVVNNVMVQMLTKPERIIRIGGIQYTLAVVIYSVNNRSHFTCHVFLENSVVYYDGMKTPKLTWQDARSYHNHVQPIAHMWYMKERITGDVLAPVEEVPALISSKLDSSSNGSGFESDSESDTLPVKGSTKRRGKFPAKVAEKPEKKQKRPKPNHYPTGISLQIVSAKGPLPKCVSCGLLLERKESRVLHKFVKDVQRGHTQQDSYHNADDCLTWMSFDQSRNFRRAEGLKDSENSDADASNASNHQSKDVAKSDLTDDYQSEEYVAERSECSDVAERVVAQSMKSWGTSVDFQNLPGIATGIQDEEQHFNDTDENMSTDFCPQDPQDKKQVVEELPAGLYYVHSILNRRTRAKKQQYLVKWVDHDDPRDNTWEPATNLPKGLVQAYNRKVPTPWR